MNDMGQETPIIFPNWEPHELMNDKKVISAGFVVIQLNNGVPVCRCYGKSYTLDINSRPEEDGKLLTKVFIDPHD